MENTLDLQDIQEKKRLSELFAKHANEAVHKISDKNHWQDGSAEKVLLHAVVGGITAKIGGDNYAAGAWGGAVNEVINGEIAKYEATHGKIDPALHQWLSATVGVIVARATGQTLQTGAAEAVYGTKWNYHAFQLFDGRKLLKEKLGIEDERELVRITSLLSKELPGTSDGVEFTESEWVTVESILIQEGYSSTKVANLKHAYIALAEEASSKGIRVTFLDAIRVNETKLNPYDELYVQSARTAVDGLIAAKVVIKDKDGNYQFPGNADVMIINAGKSWGFGGVEMAQVIDRFGRVYLAGGVNVGASLKTGTFGFGRVFRYGGGTNMSSEDLQKVLLGWSGGFSAIGGVGGNISFGEYGGIASIETGITAGVAVDFTWTVLKGKI